MNNSQEKRVNRIAHTKGYRPENVGKGSHRDGFSIVHLVEGTRCCVGVSGDGFSFSL